MVSRSGDSTPSPYEIITSDGRTQLDWEQTPTGWRTDDHSHFDAEIIETESGLAWVEIRGERFAKDAKAFVQAVRAVMLNYATIVQTYDPAERAEEKAASREKDRLDLESGRKTREQLKKENAVFAFEPGSVKIEHK